MVPPGLAMPGYLSHVELYPWYRVPGKVRSRSLHVCPCPDPVTVRGFFLEWHTASDLGKCTVAPVSSLIRQVQIAKHALTCVNAVVFWSRYPIGT